MLLYDFVPVGVPFPAAATWISSLPPALLDTAAAEAFGFSTLDGVLDHGAPRARGDVLLVGLRWAGQPTGGWFSRFEGDLAVAPLAAGSHLSLSASYEPHPDRFLPNLPDRDRVQREAEARARWFLSALARSLA